VTVAEARIRPAGETGQRGVEIVLDGVGFAYGGSAPGGPAGNAAAGLPAGLADLDLEAPAGRVTAVLGPSGAGKSTLLAIVAGLLAPDRGDVRFDGRSVVGVPPERRRLGVVFQSYALFAHMTVEDNVSFALRVRRGGGSGPRLRRRAARARVAALLERFEIAPLARRYPGQLSGGERQRVALARALASEPRALLLDEPLAALDARLRLALRAQLAERLAESGVTALYVTHDQEEAMALGDRVAVLHAGRLEQVGAPEDLYRRPATPFVASFIGEANFLPVTWHRSGDRDGGTLSGPLGRWDLDGAAASGLVGPNGSAAGNGARLEARVPGRLMVRPEDLAPAAPEAAHLLAEVVSSTFLGGRRRLRVRACARGAGSGEAPAGGGGGDGAPELQVDLPAALVARPGEVLPLTIDFRRSVLLPSEPSGQVEAGAEPVAAAGSGSGQRTPHREETP
jgi:ABC-type Fe3+/spermidine/putrescine transport system ATPase subunit